MRLKAQGVECYSHELADWEALADIDDWGNQKTRLLLWHIYIVLLGVDRDKYKPLKPHQVLPVLKPKRKKQKQDSAGMMHWAATRYGQNNNT